MDSKGKSKGGGEDAGYKRGSMDRPDSPVKHPASTAPQNAGVGGGQNPGMCKHTGGSKRG